MKSSLLRRTSWSLFAAALVLAACQAATIAATDKPSETEPLADANASTGEAGSTARDAGAEAKADAQNVTPEVAACLATCTGCCRPDGTCAIGQQDNECGLGSGKAVLCDDCTARGTHCYDNNSPDNVYGCLEQRGPGQECEFGYQCASGVCTENLCAERACVVSLASCATGTDVCCNKFYECKPRSPGDVNATCCASPGVVVDSCTKCCWPTTSGAAQCDLADGGGLRCKQPPP